MNNLVVWCLVLLALSLPAQASRTIDVYDEPRPAPEFELPGTDGHTHRLADYRGRYLLVNFWAVWCTPCRKEMPSMQQLHEQLAGEDFDMIAIHVGPGMSGAERFARELGLEFGILVDEEMALGGWNVLGLPTTFLVDRQGRIFAQAVGERDWQDEELLKRLRDLLVDR